MGTKKNTEEESGVATIKREKLQPPRKYKVLMHNDDYTTMEFVILVLKRFFNKEENEAHAIMLKIHTEGLAVCGLYTHEVAESKVAKVTGYARKEGHPLKLSYEPCD